MPKLTFFSIFRLIKFVVDNHVQELYFFICFARENMKTKIVKDFSKIEEILSYCRDCKNSSKLQIHFINSVKGTLYPILCGYNLQSNNLKDLKFTIMRYRVKLAAVAPLSSLMSLKNARFGLNLAGHLVYSTILDRYTITCWFRSKKGVFLIIR